MLPGVIAPHQLWQFALPFFPLIFALYSHRSSKFTFTNIFYYFNLQRILTSEKPFIAPHCPIQWTTTSTVPSRPQCKTTSMKTILMQTLSSPSTSMHQQKSILRAQLSKKPPMDPTSLIECLKASETLAFYSTRKDELPFTE